METSFDIEAMRFGKRADAIDLGPPIFVCGLARGGTSLVTRLLESSGDFAAPAYRDLPFALAPNSWARLGGRRSVAAVERGHGDGLLHDLESPEAIEEVFWRCFEGERYLFPEGLKPTPPAAETLTRFRRYVALVALDRGRSRYLSKNNNNVLRLEALVTAFPDAVLVHPFRNPVEQADSLLRQHRMASARHAEDRFGLQFMRWLGHHEFGGDQRPFLFDGAPLADTDRHSRGYWLHAWSSVYGALLRQPPAVAARQHFLDYDLFRAAPATGLAALLGVAGAGDADGDAIVARPLPEGAIAESESGFCGRVFHDLRDRSIP